MADTYFFQILQKLTILNQIDKLLHLTYKQSFYDYYKAYFRFLIEKCNQIKMGYMLPLCAYY